MASSTYEKIINLFVEMKFCEEFPDLVVDGKINFNLKIGEYLTFLSWLGVRARQAIEECGSTYPRCKYGVICRHVMYLEIIELLLEYEENSPGENLNIEIHLCRTDKIFRCAVEHKYIRIIKLFLRCGFPMKIINEHMIINDIEIIKLLIQHGADVNYIHKIGSISGVEIPLHEAIKRNNVEIVKLLLENGANPNYTHCGDIEETPLYLAVKGNCEEIVKLLLQHKDIKKHKDFISNLFRISVLRNNIKIMKILLKEGADESMDIFRERLLSMGSNYDEELLLFYKSRYGIQEQRIPYVREEIPVRNEPQTLEQYLYRNFSIGKRPVR